MYNIVFVNMKNTIMINLNTYKIGTPITYSIGSDCYPYEVVENISEKMILIRRMDKKVTPNHEGPYGTQSYSYHSNPENDCMMIRTGRHQGEDCFKTMEGTKVRLYFGEARYYQDPCF